MFTLDAEDISLSLEFHRNGLGSEAFVEESNPGIVLFTNGGTNLTLYGLTATHTKSAGKSKG